MQHIKNILAKKIICANRQCENLKHKHSWMPTSPRITSRLEYLRTELRAERISTQELAELQSLAPYIEPGDVELLEAAGVSEN